MRTTTTEQIARETTAPTPLDASFVWVVSTREMGDTETLTFVYRTRLGALTAILKDDEKLAAELNDFEGFDGTHEDATTLWTVVDTDETTGAIAWSNDETVRVLEQVELGA